MLVFITSTVYLQSEIHCSILVCPEPIFGKIIKGSGNTAIHVHSGLVRVEYAPIRLEFSYALCDQI